jgi:hypothetical protein
MNPLFIDTNQFFTHESVKIIPITQYPFTMDLDKKLESKLNHGFEDLPNFPSWKDFYNRSINRETEYPNYMAYLLVKMDDNVIIGVLAVQLIDYNQLKSKVHSISPKVNQYLYLSWIALDFNYQKLNYFIFLFEFYKILIRKLRQNLNCRVEGAAIIIRRMRKILWSLFNINKECPNITNRQIIKKSERFIFIFEPCEIFDSTITPVQDHLCMIFNFSN